MFSRNDHITTKMGKLPPSPCHACGSDNHWDKECPDWEVYRARLSAKQKDAHSVEKNTDEGNKLYQSAYGILLSQRVAASQIDFNRVQSDFDSAVHKEEACAFIAGKIRCGHKTGERRKVTVEEIEDESDIIARAKPKSATHILIHESESQEEERPQLSKHPTPLDVKESCASCNELKDKFPAEQRSQPKPNVHVLMNEADVGSIEPLEPTDDTLTEVEGYATTQNVPLPPPPKELKPVRMPKKRFYPAGKSSVGVSVLAVKGWVRNSANQ